MALRTSLFTLTALGAATLFCSAAALAEPAGKAADGRGAHRPHHDGLFARMDKNDDGKITPDEARTAASEFFARMDKNGDGKITPDEQAQKPGLHREKGGDKHFARMDKNGDGKLERSETKMPEEHFVRADTNKDGKLTKEEVKASFTAMHKEHAAKRFAEFDGNKNGVIEQSEALAHADQRFTSLDTNKDGTITREEARQGRPGMKQHQGKARRGCDSAGEKTSAGKPKGKAI